MIVPVSGSLRVRGFTLIELLIVTVIIGSLASLAVLNLGGADQSRQLENEARRLHAVLRMVADDAIFEAQEFGLQLQQGSYRFLRLDARTGRWEALTERGYAEHAVPEHFEMQLEVEGDVPTLVSGKPQDRPAVLLLSSGEITPFVLEMRLAEEPDAATFRIGSDGFADIELRQGEGAPL